MENLMREFLLIVFIVIGIIICTPSMCKIDIPIFVLPIYGFACGLIYWSMDE